MMLANFFVVASLVHAQDLEDQTNLLQYKVMQQKQKQGCNDPKKCPIITTTIVTTTTTTSNMVDDDTDVDGDVPNVNPWCSDKAVVLYMSPSKLLVNNLGGLGPKAMKTAGEVIHWTDVGQIRGASIDLVVEADGPEYGAANNNYVSNGKTGQRFAIETNGAYQGVGSVGSLRKGTYTFNFQFLWTDNATAAVVPYLPLTYYDVDGGVERVETCDADGSLVHKPTGVTHSCTFGGAGCPNKCTAIGASGEYKLPDNWDKLSAKTKEAAVTYLYKDKSSFKMTYTISKDHRVFVFKGSKALACLD